MTSSNGKILETHKAIALFSSTICALSCILVGIGAIADQLGNKDLIWSAWFGFIGMGATSFFMVVHWTLFFVSKQNLQISIGLSRVVGVLYLFLFPVGTVLGIWILLASRKDQGLSKRG